MSGPNELLERADYPSRETTIRLNEKINEELEDLHWESQILWLALLMRRYYDEHDTPYSMDDYILAAEMVASNE